MLKIFAALALLSMLAACTSKDDASPVDAGADAATPCATDRDCVVPGYGCGYPIAEGCAAVGRCVKREGEACNGVGVCACDGTATSACGFASDGAGAYAPKPVRVMGACAADASTDGSSE